jgi:hypothetical protein
VAIKAIGQEAMVVTEITVVIVTEIKEVTEIVTMEEAVIKATEIVTMEVAEIKASEIVTMEVAEIKASEEITNRVTETESKEVMVATRTMTEIGTIGSEDMVETETNLTDSMMEVKGLPKRASTETLAVVVCLIAATFSPEVDSDPLEVDHNNLWLPCHQTLRMPNLRVSKS